MHLVDPTKMATSSLPIPSRDDPLRRKKTCVNFVKYKPMALRPIEKLLRCEKMAVQYYILFTR
jgi:hypothetical protein